MVGDDNQPRASNTECAKGMAGSCGHASFAGSRASSFDNVGIECVVLAVFVRVETYGCGSGGSACATYRLLKIEQRGWMASLVHRLHAAPRTIKLVHELLGERKRWMTGADNEQLGTRTEATGCGICVSELGSVLHLAQQPTSE